MSAQDLGIPSAPELEGAEHLHSGKVRDLYRLIDGPYAGRLLMVASDRISAFDHVLDTTIPDKGAILTRMSLWWFEQLADLVPHHVVSTEVPSAVAGRAVICEALDMYPVECVARGYLTGSGLLDYRATGEVCGIPLPEGLEDGSRLPEPLFTPATKAALGDHDENVSYDAVVGSVGAETAARLRDLTLAVYRRAEGIARERGIILADTKLEFGRRLDGHLPSGGVGTIVLADEVLTPDSSRFWPADDWVPGRQQPSYDKQIVRNWLLSDASGWDRGAGVKPPPLCQTAASSPAPMINEPSGGGSAPRSRSMSSNSPRLPTFIRYRFTRRTSRQTTEVYEAATMAHARAHRLRRAQQPRSAHGGPATRRFLRRHRRRLVHGRYRRLRRRSRRRDR